MRVRELREVVSALLFHTCRLVVVGLLTISLLGPTIAVAQATNPFADAFRNVRKAVDKPADTSATANTEAAPSGSSIGDRREAMPSVSFSFKGFGLDTPKETWLRIGAKGANWKCNADDPETPGVEVCSIEVLTSKLSFNGMSREPYPEETRTPELRAISTIGGGYVDSITLIYFEGQLATISFDLYNAQPELLEGLKEKFGPPTQARSDGFAPAQYFWKGRTTTMTVRTRQPRQWQNRQGRGTYVVQELTVHDTAVRTRMDMALAEFERAKAAEAKAKAQAASAQRRRDL